MRWNKKIILISCMFVLIVALSSKAVSAEVVNNYGNHNPDTSGAGFTYLQGQEFKTKYNTTLVFVTKDSLCTGDTAFLMYPNMSFIKNVTFVGDNATFNYQMEINRDYFLMIGNAPAGTAYTRRYKVTAPFPIISNHLTYNASWQYYHDQLKWEYSGGHWFNFINIVTDNGTIDLDPPVINITYPTNNTMYNNYTGWINMSISETGGNCTTNDTRWSFNSGNTTHFNFLNNTKIVDGYYYIEISCWDSLGNNGSQELYLIIDEATPVHTRIFPLSSSVESRSSIIYSANYSDDNLETRNLTLYNQSNHIVYNRLWDDINVTIHNINITFNFTNNGLYTIKDCASDDHNSVGASAIEKGLRGLEYEIKKDNIEFYTDKTSKTVYVGYYEENEFNIITNQQIKDYNITLIVEEKEGAYKYSMFLLKPETDINFGFGIEKEKIKIKEKNNKKLYRWDTWSFDFYDLEEYGFELTYDEDEDYHIIYTSTQYCSGGTGEECILDPIVSGVNKICVNTTVSYGTEPFIFTVYKTLMESMVLNWSAINVTKLSNSPCTTYNTTCSGSSGVPSCSTCDTRFVNEVDKFNFAGNITINGNISADYFIGDGSLLTNLTHTLQNAYDDGNSNQNIQINKGNLTWNLTNNNHHFVVSKLSKSFFVIDPGRYSFNIEDSSNKKVEIGANSMVHSDQYEERIGGVTVREVTATLNTLNQNVIIGDNLFIGNTIQANTKIKAYANGNLNMTGNFTGNQLYGEMSYHNHTGTEINFATDGVFYHLWFTDSDTNGFTFNNEGFMENSSLTAQVSGKYRISYMASGDGQNNHNYYTSVYINEVNQNNCENHHKMAAGGDIITQPGNCFIDLNVGDNVSLRTADIGGTGTGNYYSATLDIVRIGN